jgi:acetyl-CoA carboxylase carboxyltransferase component
MVKHTAQVMVAGPALVERALNRKLDTETLGGHAVHLKSGVVDNMADDELGAFAQIRRFLGYLPSNVSQRAPRVHGDDPADRREQELLSIIPRDRRKPYKMRRRCELIFDHGSFFELAQRFGPSQITALARLDGHPVGVLANDPLYYGGAMTAAAAEKLTRLVDLCDQFHLPIISLVDQPGFMLGPQAEAEGTIRRGTAAICAVMQSRVPWASVIVRKTYGVAGAAHFGPNGVTFAWPSAESGALPIEGGVAVAFRREIAAAPDPEAKRRELEQLLANRSDPYRAGESCSVHDLLDPRETRERLCRYLELCDPMLDAQLGPVSRGPRP